MGVPSSKRFTIRRRLGEGGMGVVYEAFDEERRAPVALKTLSRFDGAALARFKREFRSLQGLAHPNLVALDELLFENEQWFFTMELLDGVDFVCHVRGDGPRVAFQSTVRESVGKIAVRPPLERGEATGSFDEAKLRDALRQLLEGLAALHAADKVHRDVKPSNVLVTRQARVVLLDFGLVTEASAEDRSTGSAVVGTPAYMAPEQAASREVGPAADLYAVGVMLYEALTGRLPIDGSQLQMLIDKQSKAPAPPASIAAGVPRDLDILCTKLLRFDPAQRPSAEDLLRSLAPPAPRTSNGEARRTSTESPTFIGRAAELKELYVAYEACVSGQLASVLVCGESGIGKSHLVRCFTAHLLADHPDALVLEGRCYERETVPYKTLDGVVDSLGSKLARLGPHDVAAILPARSAVLAQVFPALLRVPQIAKEHAATTLTVDPHEYRQRAFLALRELFTRIALRRPTVIVIDDLQWADDDGLRALAEILRPPDAPPLLLIGTVRIAAGMGDAALERLRAMTPGETRIINLAALGPDEARELARAVLRSGDNPDADPEKIAKEAGGHPLFVEELARHIALGVAARGDVRLDEAIWARIVQLDEKAREIAGLVAIAGKPIPQEIVAAAARVEPGEFTRRVAALRASNVVRTGGARWADAIEPYHDRVREAVLGRIGSEQKRSLHESLAIAFEALPQRDAEMLAAHWREAGNRGRAAKYTIAAGDQAAATFAFDRAAQWYEQALTLVPSDDSSRRELHMKLGNALGNAGRGALAAPHLEQAASQSPPGEALELRRRAAEQLLRNGNFDRGIAAMRTVLAAIGMRLPSTLWGTLIALAYYRARVRLRGLRFRERERTAISAGELTRVDTCLSIAITLAFMDQLVGFLFLTRALLLALEVGEIERIAVAMAFDAAATGIRGQRHWRRSERLLSIARPLAERSNIHAQAFLYASRGTMLFGSGRFREALDELEKGLSFEKAVPGVAFEASSARWMVVGALGILGRYKALRREQQHALADARARGDVYGSVIMCVGLGVFAWLASDLPLLADENTATALGEWPKTAFHLEHHDALLGRTFVRLYEGDAEGAFSVANELLGKTRWSFARQLQVHRVRAIHVHAMAALATAARRSGDRHAPLALAARDARDLYGERTSWTRALAETVRAGIALHGGSREEALRHLDAATRDLTTHDMLGYAAAARYHAANLRDDAAERERALDYFRGEDVIAPERMCRTLIAGFPQ